ncbi:MAG: HicB family protein [Candidatus Aquicultor secundus]|uniref:HicB family protein n=1 Tax=Candidatus Aquicultor secundus TaxID=1973895 RepID=A0A2M7T9D1_9ACTN|nr:type II toxin-antitoxin system HicB family antitoxin [Candidatus Aquicultor secundus]NCO65962.1 type II toxin-antitoxin system HicB family antitoxin [Solirubrobacter sp.]OIO86051.1 MAG: HicB family protein [Candidatus Aquicultor secundus]PIU27387.1 MAG: HicB family protein [Candidatus Aquicultor secundus]PIW22006.1 MAG: HicB family protein [Candidatus Aquicultor secundus]PIX52585.1 MAG: HicB family protein [Candidatus Aquicultor secundus]
MQYTVLIHKAEEGGYWVEVPAISGCFSQGETVEEALKNVKEAIELHLEVLKEEGKEIPTEEDVVGTVKIAV